MRSVVDVYVNQRTLAGGQGSGSQTDLSVLVWDGALSLSISRLE